MEKDFLVKTHLKASPTLLGRPVLIEDDSRAMVELVTTKDMVVDDEGLVHGGFTFGLADYAAMLAVNHPYVVIGSADVKFIAPVRLGETMRATATVERRDSKRREVAVEVQVDGKPIFKGAMNCYILDRHVLVR
jgi:acyl-coenzyme A thioesterase PaaI-like protein